MPCDERYRLWAMRQVPPAPQLELRRARLVRVSPCAARLGLRELHFDVDGVPWSWCFPAAADPEKQAAPEIGSLVLRPGPNGLIAQASTDNVGALLLPAHLDLGLAASIAMSATPVYVHRFLIGADADRRPALLARQPGLPS